MNYTRTPEHMSEEFDVRCFVCGSKWVTNICWQPHTDGIALGLCDDCIGYHADLHERVVEHAN